MSEHEGQAQGQRKGKKKQKKKFNYKLLLLCLAGLVALLGLLLVGFVGITLAKNYTLDESQLDMLERSTIYDRNGNEVTQIYDLDGGNRETISIEDIPDDVKDAFVAVEDRRFYEHRGIDFRSIGRALWRDIVARDIVEGGSTITQQLARNVFLSLDQTVMRKTEEVLIAINLEQRYSKDEILEMYLNYVYFGEGAYGIQAASQTYFDKDVHELQHEEIAVLVGLLRAPSHYNPLREENEERVEQRKNTVLSVMEELEIITAEEREEAANRELELNAQGPSRNPALNTYIDMVFEEAEEKYDIPRDELMTGGYDVYTALDLDVQETMYEAFREEGEVASEFFPEPGPEQIVQGSMVMLDHHDGAVISVMGGRDFQSRDLNWAMTDARSPGSSFKPISVYAPALEHGYEPYDQLVDEERTYGGDYTPRNLSGTYQGRVSMMEAVERSINAPAVWLLDELGVDTGVSYANAFGFDNVERKYGIALGDVGASAFGMARAFGAFDNGGIIMEPYLIERIEDRTQDVIAEHEPGEQQVVEEQTAWYMTEMLQRVVQSGTGTNAGFNHPVAGKTGSVQSDYDGTQDAWFVGYTPHYTAAVWMGFEHTDENHVLNIHGGDHPARLFRHVMSEAVKDLPVEEFQRPETAQELEPPVRLQQIGDLKAFLTLTSDFHFQVNLEFTRNNDERVVYNVYRIDPQTDDRTLIGEHISGGSYTDTNVSLGDLYAYEVVPVNSLTGDEGEPSNRATVEVIPDYPFFRRDGVDDDEFEQWLIDEGFREPEEDEEEDEDEEDLEELDLEDLEDIFDNGDDEEEDTNGQGPDGEGPPGQGDDSPGEGPDGEGPPGQDEDDDDNGEDDDEENDGSNENEDDGEDED